MSHRLSPLMRIVSRGDTTTVDAYLTPVLRRYVATLSSELGSLAMRSGGLLFMQSNGGLVAASHCNGKDAILSGPAGGVIGMIETGVAAGHRKLIGFDMGGTSTDVCHFRGSLERSSETLVAGIRLQTPQVAVHTIAAGGGSIIHFDGARYRVGPESAGAVPGPACYRRGGPLTITDCNVMLGRIRPEFFPAVFGPQGDQPLDAATVCERFSALATGITRQTGDSRSTTAVAEGFLAIAIANMAHAIRHISTQRGHDVKGYTLCSFGGAGSQHACGVADALGIRRILLHPLAGVLSALGIGLAALRELTEVTVEEPLNAATLAGLRPSIETCGMTLQRRLIDQGADPARCEVRVELAIKVAGSDCPLPLPLPPGADAAAMAAAFVQAHRQRFGFAPEHPPWRIQSFTVEAIGHPAGLAADGSLDYGDPPGERIAAVHPVVFGGQTLPSPFRSRNGLLVGEPLAGPAVILEAGSTIVVEPGWEAVLQANRTLVLERRETVAAVPGAVAGAGADTVGAASVAAEADSGGTDTAGIGRDGGGTAVGGTVGTGRARADTASVGWVGTGAADTAGMDADGAGAATGYASVTVASGADPSQADPVLLEVFNRRFMFIAEQMGLVLQGTAASVNIKERLDFSCALFSGDGALVANAPHMPVHLGSMSHSIKAVLQRHRDTGPDGWLRSGDVVMLNDPYHGDTHLPDITVVKPVFADDGQSIDFFVASRGHHADIGGRAPGSMPANSTRIEEEGILLEPVKIVVAGVFQEHRISQLLLQGPWPVRNLAQNIADLQAQIAACEAGVAGLAEVFAEHGRDTVQAYMRHVQDNAEAAIRRLIAGLDDGHFVYELDNGCRIAVRLTVEPGRVSATLDFSGTSAQHEGNFNAPLAIVHAAILYVFRCLVQDDIPLNEGCLKPLRIIVPDGCLLNPKPLAAVVAGNVEVSQAIVDALFGALGIKAAAQGTMNNVTWGNDRFQYYETLCGGDGATATAPGASAVHTHMTNSRLTDPEVLENRFPVLLETFAIRHGSGGAGHHRGGDGVIRQLRFLEAMQVNLLTNRRRIPPFGLHGGAPGQSGRNTLLRGDGRSEDLPSQCNIDVAAGDCLRIETPGGGGFGG